MSVSEKVLPLPDYNYPPMNRRDLMSLSTINSKDMQIKQFKKLDTQRDWSINLYNLDIEGTSPRKIGAFHQKIDYTNKNDDIERSWPKILHMGLNKPEYNLSNKDIEFSSPGCVKIKTTRHLNPLEPKYQFSKCETLPFETPKFIRDSIQISDIEGSKPKKIISHAIKRDTLNKDDIIGASATQPYIRKTHYSYIDYRDVTHDEFKTGRMTNPLDPIYHLSYVDGTKNTIGEIEKSKPSVFSKYKYDEPFNLRTCDILGTSVGSKNRISKFNGLNFIYNTGDIFGAQTSTLKKGIVTKRQLNPLWPKYKFLGTDELNNQTENNPYFNKNKLSKTAEPGKRNEQSKTQQQIPKFNDVNTTNIYQNNIKSNDVKNEKDINAKSISPISSPKHAEKVEVEKNEKFDFDPRAYTEDNVEFDKNDYRKPKPFYGFVHDKFLIPPIEKHKKSSVSPMESMRSIQNKILNSNSANTSFGSIPHLPNNTLFNGKGTYAQKLDQFMNKNNIKFIEPEPKKTIEHESIPQEQEA